MSATDLRTSEDRLFDYDNKANERIVAGSQDLLRALWTEHPKRMRIAFNYGLSVPPPSPVRTKEYTFNSNAFVVRQPETGRKLLQNVADAFGITYGEMIGDSRGRVFVEARAVVVAVLRERGWSFPRIGKLLGNRDHSTIIHSHRTFDINCRRNPLVERYFEKFRPLEPMEPAR